MTVFLDFSSDLVNPVVPVKLSTPELLGFPSANTNPKCERGGDDALPRWRFGLMLHHHACLEKTGLSNQIA